LILVDSTGWMEYFGKGSKADDYARHIIQTPTGSILTPTVVLLEVYRKIKKDRGEEKALEAYAHLQDTRMVPLDPHTAVAAADIGLRTGLGTVDSIIYATSTRYGAELLTGDHHFEGLPRVTLI